MKAGFYPRLARTGIRKNSRLYLPYLITSAVMVMIHYILLFLAGSPYIGALPGGGSTPFMLELGSQVILLFSVLFLFYTNSFLIRRRNTELGLYNILGMGKKNIARILLWETLFTALAALAAGLLLGVGLSKLAEMVLMNLMSVEPDYILSFSPRAFGRTALVFALIYVLLYLRSLWQLHRSDPSALLRSERVGEKPPRANWLLALLGLVILAAAYAIALSIDTPLAALTWFFVAVVMVIAATYLLFISGSVALCRLLQKSKRYYYRPNHFVSVSSMAYRMKRNGAGLASICILGTMVLVMLSSSACLYFGAEDSLRARYPQDLKVEIQMNSLESYRSGSLDRLRRQIDSVAEECGVIPGDTRELCYAIICGELVGTELRSDSAALLKFGLDTYDNVRTVNFIPLADYNRLMGTEETLAPGEALLYAMDCTYTGDSFSVADGTGFRIVRVLDDFFWARTALSDVAPTLFLVVPDMEESLAPLMHLTDGHGSRCLRLYWSCGFDTDAPADAQIRAEDGLWNSLRELSIQDSDLFYSYSVASLAAHRAEFYGTYGGLFFLGIMLSIVFLLAAVLIIYYKQISEGYEDQSRFAVMRKVGMTRREIRRSINSQMLTVFLLPLLLAILHLAFAFPFIRRVMLLFGLDNLPLLLATTGASILLFALFYIVVYRITSNTYYGLVSGAREE